MTRDIRALRTRLGLKTAELARLVGVSERTAMRWDKGERPVPEPAWRMLNMFLTKWRDYPPETIADAVRNGFSMEISPPTEEDRAQRLSPTITVTYPDSTP
jgi:transcriptional regulator with XRE-family HTH domain